MLRQLLCLLALASFACLPPSAANGHSPRRLALSAMADSVKQVRVTCVGLDEDGEVEIKRWSGSGAYLGPAKDGSGEVFFTAAHVVDDLTDTCFVLIAGDEPLLAEVIEYDTATDVALLLVPEATGHRELCMSAAYQGMEVVAMGFPRQWDTKQTDFQMTFGHLTRFSRGRWQTSAQFWFGSSGGPLFDYDGCLAGVNVSVWTANLFGMPIPLPGQYYSSPGHNVFGMYRRYKDSD